MRYAILLALSFVLIGCGSGASGPTSEVPPVVSNSSPTGTLTILGNLQVSSTLSASSTLADPDGLGAFSYQWFRDNLLIPGATNATYQLQDSDAGMAITVKVTYIDGKNFSESVVSLPTALVAARPTLQSKPNILLIIADDFGMDAFNQSAYGNIANKARTPNLDALAKTGIVFDNLWATPACTTTRGSLITGQHGVHSGINFVPAVMAASTMTLQRYLREQSNSAVYRNAVIGKWHLGGSNPSSMHPNDSGVDYYAGNLSGVLPSYNNWTLVEQGISYQINEYHTSKVTDLAIDWIGLQQSEPWFLWLAYSAPHTPFHLPPATLHSRTDLSGTDIDIAVRPRDYYLAAVEAMDTEIGRLLQSMDATTRENTVIIFIGDNGTPVQVVDNELFSSDHAKNSLYEGGIRVPMIISGKGVERANVHEAALLNTTDFFATIATLAGNTLEKINNSYSFATLMRETGETSRTFNYSEFESATVQGWVVRDASFKLHHDLNGTHRLFDISTDINEQIDLLQSGQDYSEIVNRLKAYGDSIRSKNATEGIIDNQM